MEKSVTMQPVHLFLTHNVAGSNIKHTHKVSPSAIRTQAYFACASCGVLNLHSTSTLAPEV